MSNMYGPGKVWDAESGEAVEVGNPIEAVARDKAAAERDQRPQRYFASKNEFDGMKAREAQRAADERAAADKAEADRIEAERIAAEKSKGQS